MEPASTFAPTPPTIHLDPAADGRAPILRGPVIRLAPHVYSTDSDVDAALHAPERFVARH